MMTQNETGPDRGRYMDRTHEVGSNGALTVTDLWTGVTTLAAQQPHYEALDGIVWTSWGTVLFAEERTVATLRDPDVPNAVGGLMYEYDPATGIATPRPAFGARSHEGLRFDSRGALYGVSESTPGSSGSGSIYKFVPDVPGDLSAGQLYALKVSSSSRTGGAQWVALDRQAVQIDSELSTSRLLIGTSSRYSGRASVCDAESRRFWYSFSLMLRAADGSTSFQFLVVTTGAPNVDCARTSSRSAS